MDNRAVYDRLYQYALDNYESGGWDYFVECCGFDDFCDRAAEKSWSSYEAAFQYYAETYRTLNSIRRDIQAA